MKFEGDDPIHESKPFPPSILEGFRHPATAQTGAIPPISPLSRGFGDYWIDCLQGIHCDILISGSQFCQVRSGGLNRTLDSLGGEGEGEAASLLS